MLRSAYMQSVSNTAELLTDLAAKLGAAFYSADLEKLLESMVEKRLITKKDSKEVYRSIMPIPGYWDLWKEPMLYSFDRVTDILTVLEAICKRPEFYISHYSALYFNELIEQRPIVHYLSKEIKGKSGTRPDSLNIPAVKQAFLKPARITNNGLMVIGSEIKKIEKIDLGKVGVFTKRLHFEKREFEFKLTNPSRTFVDSVISPQYAGGISTVVFAYRDHSFNLSEILEIYKKINPIYPYWQSIGFIFEILSKGDLAERWREEFKSKKMIPFYLQHEARSTWDYSEDWCVHFPKGLKANV